MHEEIHDRDEGHGPDERTAETDEPESAYDLLQRGQALLERRHNAQAAVVLERAARLEPGKASILEALGRAYFNSGQTERSRETFEALLEIDPSAHYAHFALGQSLKRLGGTGEAWTHLRLAVALAPSSSSIARRSTGCRTRSGSRRTDRRDGQTVCKSPTGPGAIRRRHPLDGHPA